RGGIGVRRAHGGHIAEAFELANQVGIGEVAIMVKSLSLPRAIAEYQAASLGYLKGVGEPPARRLRSIHVDAYIMFRQRLPHLRAQRAAAADLVVPVLTRRHENRQGLALLLTGEQGLPVIRDPH